MALFPWNLLWKVSWKEPSDPQYCFDRWCPWSQIQKPVWGRPRNSPMSPEHLTLVRTICHIWQQRSHSGLGEKRYKEQDTFAQWCVSSYLWRADCSRIPGDRWLGTGPSIGHKSVTSFSHRQHSTQWFWQLVHISKRHHFNQGCWRRKIGRDVHVLCTIHPFTELASTVYNI